MTELLEQARELRDEHGDDWDAVLAVLREAGVSIVKSAIVTSRTLGVDLGVAKRIVHYSPVWADRSEAAERIHEVFSSTLEDLAS